MNKLEKLLLESTSYKSFLKAAIDILKSENPRWSYEFFAKSSGFSSKSYVRSIFTATKRMTASALPKFIKSLNFGKETGEYFKYLVFLDESDLNTDSISKKELETRLENIRSRFRQREQKKANPISYDSEFDYHYWPIIYAALGTLEKGASLGTIQKKTKLSQNALLANLKMMKEKNIIFVDEDTGHYKAKDFHLLFEHVKEDTAIQSFFLRSLNRASQAVKFGYNDKDKVFYSAAFSIKKDKEQEFNKALLSAIYQVLEQFEDPDGAKIHEVTLGSFPWGK